jgi:hypothetical protein
VQETDNNFSMKANISFHDTPHTFHYFVNEIINKSIIKNNNYERQANNNNNNNNKIKIKKKSLKVYNFFSVFFITVYFVNNFVVFFYVQLTEHMQRA